MSIAEIEAALGEVFEDPGSLKSGEYLQQHVLEVAMRLVLRDRGGLVHVLSEWLQKDSEPQTMLAVVVAGDLRLTELVQDIESLRERIQQGKAFMPFYIEQVREALETIRR